MVGSDVVVMATPSFGVRSTAEQIAGRLSPGTVLVSVSKGIEKGTFLRMSQIIREATGDRFPVVTLSGPSHAEEVARKVPHCGGLRQPGPGYGRTGAGPLPQRPLPRLQQQRRGGG